MTALSQYARLESGGIWRVNASEQRRDVGVSFGEVTLVISDNAGRVLAHWSLAAIERVNLGTRPAVFTPDIDGDETLEIDDDMMIDAIEKVRKTVDKARPRPGRLRFMSLGVSTAIVAGLAFFWLPDALIRQTLPVVHASKRVEIGAMLLGHIQRISGTTCRDPLGNRALERLKTRLLGATSHAQIVVVPGGLFEPLYLPGGIIVLSRSMIEDYEDPAVPAGHILAASTQLRVQDPIEGILQQAGITTTFKLMTTGNIATETLRQYGEVLVAAPPVRPNDDLLLLEFERAQVPSTPYAYALDISGENTLSLIEADPISGRQGPEILQDGQWVSLQGICGG